MNETLHRTLNTLEIFTLLHSYTPVLAGTFPLAIDIETSDLDIICCAADLTVFARRVTEIFGKHTGFRIAHKVIRDDPCVVANFHFQGFEIEIFGQNRPVEQQNAYRHMQVEARLLELGGDAARQGIRRLKQNGLKTEPAFARYFDLEGDPYDTLLRLADLDDEELKKMVVVAE